MQPDYWNEACQYLSEKDNILSEIIAEHDGEFLDSNSDALHSLTRAIVGQQISVKASQAIWNRLETLLGSFTVENILSADQDKLREAGLSRPKIKYVRSIADNFQNGTVDPSKFSDLSDEELIIILCKIKGIGRWTAEMFLMFHQQRPDVFPLDDLGIKKAIKRHYNSEEYALISDDWKPYRTVASWFLWRSLDSEAVTY